MPALPPACPVQRTTSGSINLISFYQKIARLSEYNWQHELDYFRSGDLVRKQFDCFQRGIDRPSVKRLECCDKYFHIFPLRNDFTIED